MGGLQANSPKADWRSSFRQSANPLDSGEALTPFLVLCRRERQVLLGRLGGKLTLKRPTLPARRRPTLGADWG